jgi:heme-degrading monooxygenase HmoA
LHVDIGALRWQKWIMIARVWHGWTSAANAVEYETIYRTVVLSHLTELAGYRGAQLLKRATDGAVEFISITYFDSLESVVAFAGHEYERAVVTQHAKRVLMRFDERCQHYEVAIEGSVTQPESFALADAPTSETMTSSAAE